MLVETPVENPPPVIDTINIPDYARSYCDKWGNIKQEPLKTIQQKSGGDFINVFIYKTEKGFFYGFQLKLRKLVLFKNANVVKDTPAETEEKAREAARLSIVESVGMYSKNMLKHFMFFDKICYNQLDLF